MTCPPHRGDVQISHLHNLALCTEIGERLGIQMGQMAVGMPPHLVMLVKQLCDESSEPIRTELSPSLHVTRGSCVDAPSDETN
jgi:hypothetical protein